MGITCRIFFIWMLCHVSRTSAQVADLGFLRELELKHPFCEDRVQLNVGPEFFVEIANSLKARDTYNKLIREYRKQNWSGFDTLYEEFRLAYPSSPLKEASTFLRVQTFFERVKESEDLIRAEREMREAFVLYPDSSWVPVMYATAGSKLLAQRQLSRALAFFERGFRDFPESPLRCVFQLGVGEARMLGGDRRTARAPFAWVVKNCRNQTLRTGARLRLVDLELNKESDNLEKQYDKIISEGQNVVLRLYHGVFHNIGEVKFRRGRYKSAAHYFNEYLRHDRGGDCRAYALKRLADIKFKRGERIKTTIASYLEAAQGAKDSDPGRFSRLHALLLDSPTVSTPEFERRIRVFDEVIRGVRQTEFRELLFIEKGLATLARGDVRGFGYLKRVGKRTQFSLKKGRVAAFIRDSLLETLEREVKGNRAKHHKLIVKEIHDAYDHWLKGTEYESRAKKLVTKLVLSNFKSLVLDSREDAFVSLIRGMDSELWSAEALEGTSRGEFIDSILLPLGREKNSESIALQYIKFRERLKPILGKYSNLFWQVVRAEARDQVSIEDPSKFLWQIRELDRLDLSANSLSYVHKTGARILADQGHSREAIKLLGRIPASVATPKTDKVLFSLYVKEKKFKEAFGLGMKIVKENEAETGKYIPILISVIKQGKLWRKAPELLAFVRSKRLSDEIKAPVLYLSGISEYERDRCKNANGYFERAVLSSEEGPLAHEGKFKYAKCLVKLGKRSQAIRWWKNVSQSEDSFWSPLARTQLGIYQ